MITVQMTIRVLEVANLISYNNVKKSLLNKIKPGEILAIQFPADDLNRSGSTGWSISVKFLMGNYKDEVVTSRRFFKALFQRVTKYEQMDKLA